MVSIKLTDPADMLAEVEGRQENLRALAWRKAARLSRPRLSELTGFSVASIVNFERGSTVYGRPISSSAWKRYRMACAAVASRVTGFDWEA
jgi:hypothetical protein